MPSQAQSDLEAGFNDLLAQHGEILAIRDVQITGLVNRNPPLPAERPGFPNFSEREYSVIAIKRTALSPLPRSGETATDGFGHKHRVEMVEPRGETYYLHCKTTPGTIGQ